jgi:hypothetical protein
MNQVTNLGEPSETEHVHIQVQKVDLLVTDRQERTKAAREHCEPEVDRVSSVRVSLAPQLKDHPDFHTLGSMCHWVKV